MQNLMEISFDYYKVFYEVARSHSITLAASHLCLTQPTVTKYIKNLEAVLNCQLFLRSQKGGFPDIGGSAPLSPDQPSLPANGTGSGGYQGIRNEPGWQNHHQCYRADNALFSASLYGAVPALLSQC